jgi:hypothetical protein
MKKPRLNEKTEVSVIPGKITDFLLVMVLEQVFEVLSGPLKRVTISAVFLD